jgi:hypothetical protein
MSVRTCVSYKKDIANYAMQLLCDTKFPAPVAFLYQGKKVTPKNFFDMESEKVEWLVDCFELDQPQLTREYYASQGLFIQSILFDMDRLRVDAICQEWSETGSWQPHEMRLG